MPGTKGAETMTWHDIFEVLRTEQEVVKNLLAIHDQEASQSKYGEGFQNGMKHTEKLLRHYANHEQNENQEETQS